MNSSESVPPLIEETQSSQIGSFYFDAESGTFVIDGLGIAASQFNVRTRLALPMVSDRRIDFWQQGGLITIINSVILTPRTSEWIQRQGPKSDFNGVVEVMKEVYETCRGRLTDERSPYDKVFGFSSTMIRDGHVRLSVAGNCACATPEIDGTFVEMSEWESGFTEYGLHNVDAPSQHTSLLAGLGHLAFSSAE